MRLGPEWFRTDDRMFYERSDGGGGGGGGGDEETLPTDAEIDAMADLGDAGKKALKDQRDRRKAERDKRVAAETERDALKAAADERDVLKREKADREKADRERTEREATEAGKHQELAESRRVELERVTGELETAKATVTTLTEQNDRMKKAIETVIDADWKALPKEVADAYSGAADDAIAKMEWLPRGKALATALEAKGERRDGHRQDPDPNNTGRPTVEQEVAALRARGNVSPF